MAESITLAKLYEELLSLKGQMARREDIEALIDTPLIRANKATMRQLAASRRDVKTGRVRVLSNVDDFFR
jgi:hypothetical protein